ncbi:DsbA family protein [Candidatus Parcubacteria bacterium]|nr:DsbA family protein [Candidatus Parcubacteria bacterium]
MEPQDKQSRQMIPLAIVVAGALIAGAIYFGGKPSSSASLTQNTKTGQAAPVGEVAPVSAKDHVLGNANTAKVVLIEYSDLECPFCKVFHNTIHQLMDTYKNGELAVVFRQFPIAQLHSKAAKEAEASECAAELGGNEGFWKFLDGVFATTNSNNSLDPAELPVIAGDIGLDVTAFNTCLSSGKYAKLIADGVTAAVKAGAQGTPYSVLVTKSGKKSPVNGAQPFATVKAQIDALLK